MAQELLRLENITRRITSEFYIRGVDLTVYRGEVLALAGKNAAGKSTLSAVINGSLPADSGRIRLDGNEITIRSPEDARALGIVTLQQNNAGFPEMSVADNILFGNPRHYVAGVIGTKRLFTICEECFTALQIQLDARARFGSLTPAQKQLAALARAYLSNARLIIMDEPSSHLPQREYQTLCGVVRALREAGVSVLYITHRLGEILELCDRVAVIQRGEVREVRNVSGMTELDLIEAIEGYRVESVYGRREGELGGPLLEARGFLPRGASTPVSFTLREGGLLAVLGGADSFAPLLCRALCGLERSTGGLLQRGEALRLQSPLDADAHRIVCAVDESTEATLRHYDSKGGKSTGTLARLTAGLQNTTEALGRVFSGFVGTNRLHHTEYMTGGYRQRELMQRTMARDGDIYILVNPVNGVDLQTRLGIYADIRRAQECGRGVILFTGDMEEALGLADTLLLLRPQGEALTLSAQETSPQELRKLWNMEKI